MNINWWNENKPYFTDSNNSVSFYFSFNIWMLFCLNSFTKPFRKNFKNAADCMIFLHYDIMQLWIRQPLLMHDGQVRFQIGLLRAFFRAKRTFETLRDATLETQVIHQRATMEVGALLTTWTGPATIRIFVNFFSIKKKEWKKRKFQVN